MRLNIPEANFYCSLMVNNLGSSRVELIKGITKWPSCGVTQGEKQPYRMAIYKGVVLARLQARHRQ